MGFPAVKSICLVLTAFLHVQAQSVSQWRGPGRNGVYPEYHLLKAWPTGGPELLWEATGIGPGFSSPTPTEDGVYLTGRRDSVEMLTVFSHTGQRIWQMDYGRVGRWSYPDTRCTPTVSGHQVYLISGMGEVVCVDMRRVDILWRVPAYERFQGIAGVWGIAENPLLVGDKVIYTPGGFDTHVVALHRDTGDLIWKSQSLPDSTAFTSPIMIRSGLNTIVVTVTQHYISGFQAENGLLLWSVKYSDIEPPQFHALAPRNNCNTPLFYDNRLYVTSGYNHVGVQFKLSRNGTRIRQTWIDTHLDCHHGQVVKVGPSLFGSNWLDNRHGQWCCIDWATGRVHYGTEWKNKGSIIAADGMLYCYEEQGGNLALVEASEKGFHVRGTLQITRGKGPHWAQPAIYGGRLYIRRGDWLGVYQLRATPSM